MSSPQIVNSFRKSSYSGANLNECVEVAETAYGGRAVRDSKRPAHGTTYHSPTAWAAFLTAVKADGSH
ncbi:DUF397 domain-containing protein [Streptomyces sp. NPDC006649]|uniref:DUF397 domain-containing protein n=1 Tax=Streptomyces sp. NPDC006649 TaxID=3156896 RepID=UPI0033B31BC7